MNAELEPCDVRDILEDIAVLRSEIVELEAAMALTRQQAIEARALIPKVPQARGLVDRIEAVAQTERHQHSRYTSSCADHYRLLLQIVAKALEAHEEAARFERGITEANEVIELIDNDIQTLNHETGRTVDMLSDMPAISAILRDHRTTLDKGKDTKAAVGDFVVSLRSNISDLQAAYKSAVGDLSPEALTLMVAMGDGQDDRRLDELLPEPHAEVFRWAVIEARRSAPEA